MEKSTEKPSKLKLKSRHSSQVRYHDGPTLEQMLCKNIALHDIGGRRFAILFRDDHSSDKRKEALRRVEKLAMRHANKTIDANINDGDTVATSEIDFNKSTVTDSKQPKEIDKDTVASSEIDFNKTTVTDSKQPKEIDKDTVASSEIDFNKSTVTDSEQPKEKEPQKSIEDEIPRNLPEEDVQAKRSFSKYCVLCKRYYSDTCLKHGDHMEKLEKTKAVLSLPSRMTIQESRIPYAGLGVFAVELIQEGSVFGLMQGERLSEEEYNKRIMKNYVWEIYNEERTIVLSYLDCQDQTKSDWMRFVNCARFEEEQNLIAEQYGDGIYYKVYKKILPGDELLVWYGNVYGNELREVFNKQSDDNNIDGLLENKSTESNSESLLKESRNVENLLQDSQKTPVDKPPAALNNSKLTDSENENIFKNEKRRKVNTLLFDDEESTDTPVSEVENNTTASTNEKQSPEKKRKVKDEKKILKWQLIHQTLQRQHVEVKLRLQLEQQKQQLQLHQLHLKQQQEFQQRQQLQIVEMLKQLQQIKSVDNERVLLNAIENGEEIIPGLSNLIMSYPPLSSQSLTKPNVTSTADFTKFVLNSQRSKVGGFECDFCPASFASPILLESHQCKNKLFSCQLCGLVKNSKKSFKAHMKNHRCKHCKAFYSTPRQLIEHRQLEHSDLLFTCLHCSKQFDSQLLLGSHIRRVHENKFTCDFCHKTLATAFTLKQHLDRHIQKRLVL